MLYGREGMDLRVPASATVLQGQDPPALSDASAAIARALQDPIGSEPLAEMIQRKQPATVAITVSDITRPVPNAEFLRAIIDLLNACGVADSRIRIIIGTGMHRPSASEERRIILGAAVLSRVSVIDHRAADASTLVQVCREGEIASGHPPVSICRAFAEADFRIVTGLIEPHFMAGFSGGRKGICPALVDLKTLEQFHGYRTLADARADTGVLDGNPCHELALKIARAVGVDFLFNVAISRSRKLAAIYCGDLVEAHRAGCREVAGWTTAKIDGPYDLIITNGGGFPLDQTFYQVLKGMGTAMPALSDQSTLLQVSDCGEGLGSTSYSQMLLEYGNDWRRFLADISGDSRVRLDQWALQMHARVLARIGHERLWFVTDKLTPEVQRKIGVHPILGEGDTQARAQRAIDAYVGEHPNARIAAIPDGPYTMLSLKA